MEECANDMGGAKVRKCSNEGCANQEKCDWVGCEILLREEEYARSMGQNAKNVPKKDAQVLLKKKDCACRKHGTSKKACSAATMVAQITLKKVEF
mmetsp:Transcript_25892/g.51914  ORF Transcript_25892/g.51914 Transcript_25892/m.51914 type:complete len:95 (+) Transcript_25892:263-547(+)